jgi:hypothetical protein
MPSRQQYILSHHQCLARGVRMMRDMQWTHTIDTANRMSGMIIPRVCTARMALTLIIDGHRLRMMKLTLLHLTSSSPWWSSLFLCKIMDKWHSFAAFSRNEGYYLVMYDWVTLVKHTFRGEEKRHQRYLSINISSKRWCAD